MPSTCTPGDQTVGEVVCLLCLGLSDCSELGLVEAASVGECETNRVQCLNNNFDEAGAVNWANQILNCDQFTDCNAFISCYNQIPGC